eukprot:701521-Prymnesium_polylepis.2
MCIDHTASPAVAHKCHDARRTETQPGRSTTATTSLPHTNPHPTHCLSLPGCPVRPLSVTAVHTPGTRHPPLPCPDALGARLASHGARGVRCMGGCSMARVIVAHEKSRQ